MKLGKRNTVIAVSALTAVAAGGLSVVMIPSVPRTVEQAGTDLMTLLRARSPGDRAAGAETTKTKPPKQMAALPARSRPVSKVLSTAAPPVAAPAPAPPVAIAAPAAVAPVAPAVAAPPVMAAAPAAGSSFPIAGLALIPLIPILTDGGDGGGTPGVSNPPPPGPAIPEPATWLMMITGFGILGAVLRRRRKLANRMSSAGKQGRAAVAHSR